MAVTVADRPASMRILHRWSALALSVFALTLACGLCLIALTPKVYVATAEIAVTEQRVTDQADASVDQMTLLDEVEELQAPSILQPIITDLQLDKKWAQRFSKEEPLEHLRSHLKLDLKTGTNVITISVFSDVPLEAADIANAIADRYKTMRDVEEDQRTNRGKDALRSQIADQEKVVADKQRQLSVAAKGTPLSPEIPQLDQLRRDLLEAQEDHDARLVLMDHVNKMHDGEIYNTFGSFSRSDVISPALRIAMKQDCDMAQKRVDKLREQIDASIINLNKNQLLNTQLDAWRELIQNQSLLDALNVRLRQINANPQLDQSPIRILSRAEAPPHPLQPNVPIDLLLSAVAGLLLGITVASFVELLLWLRR